MPGMDRANLEALRKAGKKVVAAQAALEAARAERRRRLAVAYREGWSWKVLAEAGRMSPYTVQQDLRRTGDLAVDEVSAADGG